MGIKYTRDPVFGIEVPAQCPDVPADLLDPAGSWADKKEYDKPYRDLATRFIEDFEKKFEDRTPREVIDAGPRL
jgi:phosphoenolpyruvate carboxykinase (ATP)